MSNSGLRELLAPMRLMFAMLALLLPASPGFAANATVKDDEAAARNDRRGLWRGCFVAPQEFRHGKKDGTLLGAACRSDKDREIRQVLFPEEPATPPGCNIKAKFAVRARVTGNLGIYH